MIFFIIHIIVSYDQNIFLIFLCERWIPCQALPSVLCLHYRPETVHCSTKDVYTSEITFLALHPWLSVTSNHNVKVLLQKKIKILPINNSKLSRDPVMKFMKHLHCFYNNSAVLCLILYNENKTNVPPGTEKKVCLIDRILIP